MSTLHEIKSAIANLSPHDKALLTAELFAMNAEPDSAIADLKQIVEFVAEDNRQRFSASTFLINCARAFVPFYAVL